MAQLKPTLIDLDLLKTGKTGRNEGNLDRERISEMARLTAGSDIPNSTYKVTMKVENLAEMIRSAYESKLVTDCKNTVNSNAVYKSEKKLGKLSLGK